MNVRFFFGAALIAAGAAASLAGCSGGASPATPAASLSAQTKGTLPIEMQIRKAQLPFSSGRLENRKPVRSWVKAANGAPAQLLYISDSGNNVVNLYNPAGSSQTPIGQLGGFAQPEGMYVDPNRNLWVSNTNDQQVLGYHKGGLFPYKTLTDTTGYPDDVCGNRASGTLYAADIQSAPSEGFGQSIDVYAHGSAIPTKILTDPNSEYLFFCAVDSHGNLFVSLYNQSGNYYTSGEIDEFKVGQTTPTVLITGLYYPLGIAFDKYNSLIVADTFAQQMYVFDPPYTEGPATSFPFGGYIAQIALNSAETSLWGTDALKTYGQEFSYPGGTVQDDTSTSELYEPLGAAMSPAARP